jgi:hypothetical protein
MSAAPADGSVVGPHQPPTHLPPPAQSNVKRNAWTLRGVSPARTAASRAVMPRSGRRRSHFRAILGAFRWPSEARCVKRARL